MAHYHYILNGVQKEPIPQEQLVAAGVTSTTLVWTEGMVAWQAAGQVSELASLFAQTPPPPPPSARQIPDNYLVWAILSAMFCFFPTGVVSVIYAVTVDSKFNRGDYAGAEKASKEAKRWAIISAVVAVACVGFALMMLLFSGIFVGLLGTAYL